MTKILLFLFTILIISQNAYCGTGGGKAQIEGVGNWNSTDLVFFYTDTYMNKPACNDYNGRWVIDISTDLGRAQYSLLLSAQAQGKPITVSGNNLCNLYGNSETVRTIGFEII